MKKTKNLKTKTPTGSKPEPPKPPTKFQLNQIINVPERIHDSGKAEIWGYEWGPDNWRLKGYGWVYYVRFEEGGGQFLATEEEITKWQST